MILNVVCDTLLEAHKTPTGSDALEEHFPRVSIIVHRESDSRGVDGVSDQQTRS